MSSIKPAEFKPQEKMLGEESVGYGNEVMEKGGLTSVVS